MCDTCDNPPVLARHNDPLVWVSKPGVHNPDMIYSNTVELSKLRAQYLESITIAPELGPNPAVIEFLNLSAHRQDRVVIAWARFTYMRVELKVPPPYTLNDHPLFDHESVENAMLTMRPSHD